MNPSASGLDLQLDSFVQVSTVVAHAACPGAGDTMTSRKSSMLPHRPGSHRGATPVAVREYYQTARGLELVEIEDEVVEAEAVYAEGDFRAYAKATASCPRGSDLLVVIGPASDLPTPGGRPS